MCESQEGTEKEGCFIELSDQTKVHVLVEDKMKNNRDYSWLSFSEWLGRIDCSVMLKVFCSMFLRKNILFVCHSYQMLYHATMLMLRFSSIIGVDVNHPDFDNS